MRPLALILVTVFLLSGCALLQREEGSRDPRVGTPRATQDLPQEGVIGSPPAPKRAPKAPESYAMIETRRIDSVIGLNFDGTQSLLGTPTREEIAAPARIWSYEGSSCVLSLYFYPEVEGGIYRVLSYKVSGAEESAGFGQRCFASLLHQKQTSGVN